MAKYSLVMTPTPCRVAGYIISIRPMYSYARAFTYLLAYTVGSVRTKPAISPKRLKIERTLLLTVYIKSYTGFRLPPKCMTLNNLWARLKVVDSFNAAKMTKYSVVITPTPCKVAECIIVIRPTNSCAPCTCLLTYLLTQNNQCFGYWPVIQFSDFSANDLSSLPLPLVGPKITYVLDG